MAFHIVPYVAVSETTFNRDLYPLFLLVLQRRTQGLPVQFPLDHRSMQHQAHSLTAHQTL